MRLKQAAADALPGLAGDNSGSGASLSAAMGDFPPPEEVFFPDMLRGRRQYRRSRHSELSPATTSTSTRLQLSRSTKMQWPGKLDMPEGIEHEDEFFGETGVYYDEVVSRLSIARATPEAMSLDLEV